MIHLFLNYFLTGFIYFWIIYIFYIICLFISLFLFNLSILTCDFRTWMYVIFPYDGHLLGFFWTCSTTDVKIRWSFNTLTRPPRPCSLFHPLREPEIPTRFFQPLTAVWLEFLGHCDSPWRQTALATSIWPDLQLSHSLTVLLSFFLSLSRIHTLTLSLSYSLS